MSKPNLTFFLSCPNFRFLIPIAFQQTNRPVPVVYSLNTEFQLCNNEKVFLMDPTKSEMSLAEMDYKGAFSKGRIFFIPVPGMVLFSELSFLWQRRVKLRFGFASFTAPDGIWARPQPCDTRTRMCSWQSLLSSARTHVQNHSHLQLNVCGCHSASFVELLVTAFLMSLGEFNLTCSPNLPRANPVWPRALEPRTKPERRLQAAAGEGLPVHRQGWLRAFL